MPFFFIKIHIYMFSIPGEALDSIREMISINPGLSITDAISLLNEGIVFDI